MGTHIDWTERALELEADGKLDEAIEAHRAAIAAEPRNGGPWFNLGLLHKRARRWNEALQANMRAAALDPENEGAWWNMGIAATALGDWPRARTAWKKFGVPIPKGKGPIELPLGPVPIRLDPAGKPEIVWCRRIDPARAIIENIPLPTSGRRYGDLLLHDGAPNGFREIDGRKVPVFDELALLQASTFTTFRVPIEAPGRPDVDALGELLEKRKMSIEDWTSSLRHLCKACSVGMPHEHHGPNDTAWTTSREIGVAAASEAAVAGVLQAWVAAGKGRAHGKVEAALEGGQRN